MNQALPENSQRVWNINLRYQRAIQRFAFTHNIVFFCNGFMVFLSQITPLGIRVLPCYAGSSYFSG